MQSSTSSSFPSEVAEDIARETAHFSASPKAFFAAWKRGVVLAGVRYFGHGTCANPNQAASVWDLRPKVEMIEHAIGTMSSGEKVFLATLVGFYNSKDGGGLWERIGVHGLADLGGLDLKRRAVIADLILNYTGW